MSTGQPARTVVVVGAGIGGLAAAFDLCRAGASVTVVDPADRPGGKLRTTAFAGIDVDESADMFLARVPGALELCHDLGLAEELISPAIGVAAVVHEGALRRLPEGLLLGVPTDLEAVAASGLLSEAGLRAVAADLTRPEGPPGGGDPALDGDVAVGELVRSRIGDEAFDVFVDPLLSGVNAGRADELSAELGAAQLLAAARRDASLVRGARALVPAPQPGATRPPVFHAVPGGMGRLVTALVDALDGADLRLGTAVASLAPGPDGGWRVHTDDGAALDADAVVLATPAPVTAALLAELAPTVAAGLAGLRYASVAVVALAYEAAAVPVALDYSGFLVPRRAGRLLTACSWASAKWPHLGADGLVRLRASVGRSDDERFVAMSDTELLAAVRAELAELMGIEAEPVAWRVHRWLHALPQYRPGHREQVDRWEAELAERAPGLVLAGASLRGLGIPACITSGRRAATRLLGG
ncbi:MAG: protoporphyrinogen oxidase [Acidimicrobiia bacterium]